MKGTCLWNGTWEHENITEVLAGLKTHFGTPIETSFDIDSGSSQQQWVWHTGDDVITAIKSDESPFLLAYKPSLLDPSFLGWDLYHISLSKFLIANYLVSQTSHLNKCIILTIKL